MKILAMEEKTHYKYVMLLSYVTILAFARGRKRKFVFNIR
jgi:hypothetical protein